MLHKGRINSKNFTKRGTNSISSASSGQAYTNNNQLYMGDLDPQWDEQIIKTIWSQLLKDNIRIKMLKRNNMNPGTKNIGYCFVEFSSGLYATEAINKNGVPVPGYPERRLKLNWSNMNNIENKQYNSNSSSNANIDRKQFSIFVGDLAPNVTNMQLYTFFKEKYPSTDFANVKFDPRTHVSKGYGFVKFSNPVEQQRAMLEMQNAKLNGRSIKIGSTTKTTNSYSNANNYVMNKDTHYNTSNMNNKNVPNNVMKKKLLNNKVTQTTELISAIQKLPTLNNHNNPQNTTIEVTNLPTTMSQSDISLFFKPMGLIRSILHFKDSGSTGTNSVRIQFVHRDSAMRAMQNLQDYKISSNKISICWGEPLHSASVPERQVYPHRDDSKHLTVAGWSAVQSLAEACGLAGERHVLV